jgi:hypothetical protein
MPNYTDDHRAKALLRANNMAKLFKKEYFGDIVDVITGLDKDTSHFDAACAKAGLAPEETAWLWNYLKHCGSKTGAVGSWSHKNVKDGATTGW